MAKPRARPPPATLAPIRNERRCISPLGLIKSSYGNDAESHVVCGTRYPLPACKLTGLVRRTPRQKSRPFSMIRYDHEVVQSQVGESGWLTKQLNKRLRTLVPSTSACAPSRIGWKYTIS